MSEFAQALATEETFEWQGQTYKMSGLIMEVVGQWENWLKERAWREVLRSQRFLPPAEHDRQCRLLQEGLAAGDYDFFSAASVKAQQSWEGKIFLAWARTAINHKDFKIDIIRAIYERDIDKFVEIQRKLNGMDLDPNSKAPPEAGPAVGSSSPSVPLSLERPGVTVPGKSVA